MGSFCLHLTLAPYLCREIVTAVLPRELLWFLHLTYIEELVLVFNYSQEFKQRYPGWTPPQDS